MLLQEPPNAKLPAVTIRRRVVGDERELAELADRWRELLDNSVRPEPMLSPDWLLNWWRIYGGHRSLCVGVYEADDQLIGLAPMCARIHRYRGGLRFRRIEALGAEGEERDGVCSEYLHLVVRRGYEVAVCEEFVAGMTAGEFGQWDEWVLPSVDGTHPLTEPLARAWTRAGRALETTQISECPYLTLPASWDDYLASLPSRRRRTVKNSRREFDAWAEGKSALHRATDAASLAEGKRVLQSLHRERWQADGDDGAFASPRFVAFHDSYMENLLAEERLELYWLTVAGRPVAAQYSIRFGDKLYYYQAGRALDVPADVRLGIVLTIDVLRDVMSRGLREFDFLQGQAQYKTLFADASRPLVDLRVARFGWRENLRRILKWGSPLVRKMKARLFGGVNQTERTL